MVGGPVIAGEAHISERADIEDIYADTLVMEERVTARNIYARNTYLEEGCRILGEPQYIGKLRSEEKSTLLRSLRK
ncbi:MAG: hypothetical protein QXR40_05415 [Candidatus Bathyarchaeia archaeon]